MTYEQIFEKTKQIVMEKDTNGLTGHLAVQINITGEGEGAFYIELKDGKVDVQPYEYYDRDCILIASAENFLKICQGTLDPTVAFTLGKLKVEGSIEKALEFQKIVNSVRNK